jgi:hypothetical protein
VHSMRVEVLLVRHEQAATRLETSQQLQLSECLGAGVLHALTPKKWWRRV